MPTDREGTINDMRNLGEDLARDGDTEGAEAAKEMANVIEQHPEISDDNAAGMLNHGRAGEWDRAREIAVRDIADHLDADRPDIHGLLPPDDPFHDFDRAVVRKKYSKRQHLKRQLIK